MVIVGRNTVISYLPNLEELTDEELQKLRKDDLILIVKELQYKSKTLTRQKKQLQDKVYDLFIKL